MNIHAPNLASAGAASPGAMSRRVRLTVYLGGHRPRRLARDRQRHSGCGGEPYGVGREAADPNTASLKCTWAFQNPAVTLSPVPSSTVAWSGTRTWPRRPTALMVAPVMTTTPSAMGASVGEM